MTNQQALIETAFDSRHEITPEKATAELKTAVTSAIDGLDCGYYRIAEPTDSGWRVNQWLKKAVLLFFRLHHNHVIDAGFTRFYDKVPLKYTHTSAEQFDMDGVRIVPQAMVRKGAYVAKNTVLMPSYINIGAFIDEGAMIDTWATVGSCAQIGKGVHLSGGAGIGGVLEPLQANPTIIEDDCFIGARAEIVEGVIVEAGSVIAMGVFLGQSTKIYHRETGEISHGRIPAGSVVIPGSLPAKDGRHSTNCAVIVKQVDASTCAKVSVNELLRHID